MIRQLVAAGEIQVASDGTVLFRADVDASPEVKELFRSGYLEVTAEDTIALSSELKEERHSNSFVRDCDKDTRNESTYEEKIEKSRAERKYDQNCPPPKENNDRDNADGETKKTGSDWDR
jgi:hypothetical protein